MKPHLVQNPPHHLVEQLLDGLGLLVKRWDRWDDGYTQAGHAQHVFQMDGVEGTFPGNEDEALPFFEDDIGGPADEILGKA